MSLNEGNGDNDGEQQQNLPNIQIQALMGEMRRMMRIEMERVHDRLDRVEGGRLRQADINHNRQRERAPHRRWRNEEEEYHDDFDEGEGFNMGNRRQEEYHRRDREDNSLGSIKMNIPSFQGKNDPEAYLDWERKVELVFDCHNYSEEKKVKIAAIEFTDYAIV